jgi:type 1 glutamine amidotransferase
VRLLLAVVGLLGLAGCGGPAAPVPAASSVRVLVFTRTAGFRHDSIPAGVAAIRELSAAGGYRVDATDDAGAIGTANLRRYHAVVFLSTTGDLLDTAQQQALEGYVTGGGGFVGVHAAADAEYHWPFYGELVGAWFASHGAVEPGRIEVVDRRHPATAQLGATWTRTDEWYSFRSRPDAHVLLRLGADHPIAWCHPVGAGRSFYTALGHTAGSYAEPAFRAHLQGAIRWAAGLVPADCGTDESPAAAATGLSLPGPGEAPDFYLYSGDG